MATDNALVRGERPSGEIGKFCKIGMDSLRDVKRIREELVDNTFILSVSSLNAPTNSTTIFPPGCSSAVVAVGVGFTGFADSAGGLRANILTAATVIRRVCMVHLMSRENTEMQRWMETLLLTVGWWVTVRAWCSMGSGEVLADTSPQLLNNYQQL